MPAFQLRRHLRVSLSGTVASSGSVSVDATSTANAFTLSGPTTGTTGSASTFTVTPNGTLAATTTVTLSATNGGSVSVPFLTFGAGSSSPLTFTVTRSTDGTSSVSITNSAGLSNLGSPISFSTTVAAASYDWATRSTGAGVVWAHNFASAGELTAHKTTTTYIGAALDPTIVSDSTVGNALRIVTLGAKLTTAMPASGGVGPRPMVIDDATYFPDPATAGNYMVLTAKPSNDQQNNLWLVTAKSGNTLTVTWQAATGQPWYNPGGVATQRDWAINDVVGQQSASDWRRIFSALKSDSNGKSADDINRPGNQLRSRNDKATWNWGTQAFGYGWYGHPDYQASFSTWRPSDYGGGAIDSVLRSNLWDGDEFYIQWRQKLDTRLHTNVVPAYADGNRYQRKGWMLQAEMTVPQQITGMQGPGGTRFWIPSTPQLPAYMSAYSFGGGLAGRRLSANLDGSGTYQPGGPYASTATVTADLPAGSAWEMPSGEWVTFLLHVKPGHIWSRSNPSATGVRDTTVELFVARQGDAAYTTVFSMTDQAIAFGSSGPSEDTWTTALPGYSAIQFTGYANYDLSADLAPASYVTDFAEVIFSKQTIPVPAIPPLQISGSNWTPNVDTSNRILDTDWTQLPLNTWVSARTNKINDILADTYTRANGALGGLSAIIRADSGGGWDHVNQRLILTGGGHGDSSAAENEIVFLDSSTLRFSVFANRSAPNNSSIRHTDRVSTTANYIDGPSGGGDADCPDKTGRAPARHSYDAISFASAADSGTTGGLICTYYYGVETWDIASASYDTPWFNHGASNVMPQNGGWTMTFMKYPYLLLARDYYYVDVWDMSQRDTTTYSTNPGGAPLPNPTSRGKKIQNGVSVGFAWYYADKLLARDEKNYRAFLICTTNSSGTGSVLAYRINYGAAIDQMVASGNWTTFGSHVTACTLSGPNASDFTAPSLLASDGNLYASGATYDEANQCLWIVGNNAGSYTWRIDGVLTNTWVVTRVTSATLTLHYHGSFGQTRAARLGPTGNKVTVLMRVTETSNYPEVMRVTSS